MPKRIKNSTTSKKLSSKNDFFRIRYLWTQRTYALPILLILIVTALLYTRALQNGILSWDDHWHITDNGDIKSLALSNLKAIFSSYYLNMYHPFVTLSFAFEYYLFGLNSAVYHATNVILHLTNIVLVFYFVMRLSNRRDLALIVACLFGIHPMHVESVAWITERKDVLYACFYLLALIHYVRYVQKEGNKYYWLSLLMFICSLFSKSTAVTLPLILLVVDFYLNRKITKQVVLEKIPFLLCAVTFGMIALNSQSETTSFSILSQYASFDRLFFASYSLCFYLFHVFIPIGLTAFHPLPEKVYGYLPVEYYVSILPIVLCVLIAVIKGRLRKEYLFGILFFFIAISLNIHLIPFGKAIVAERYSYIPFIGIYYIIGSIIVYALEGDYKFKSVIRRTAWFGGGLVVLVFCYLTFQRIGVWKSTESLFQDAYEKSQTHKEAADVRALEYVLIAEEKTNARDYQSAITLYGLALSIDSLRAESYSNRGIAKHCLRDYEGAMRDYSKAIQLNPAFSRAYANRAAIYIVWGQREKACADFQKAYNLGLTSVLPALDAYCSP
jgi:protein O-mannosyl-transferase